MSMFNFMGGYGYDPGSRGLARTADAAALDAKTEVIFLKERVDHLVLVCMAMWSIIEDKTDVTDEELLNRVQKIDLTDGKKDGEIKQTVQRCPNCHRAMSPRHPKCIYCGHERLEQSAFDGV